MMPARLSRAPVEELFSRPRHPYTEGLLRAVPRLSEAEASKKSRLETIEGVVPNPLDWPDGCRFAPRCHYAEELCRSGSIEPKEVSSSHSSRCRRVDEIYPPANTV